MGILPKIEGAGVQVIGPDTPLRLSDAVKIAFPAGGMTVAGLRREIGRGNLVVERIAGKQFTTLDDIRAMREKCRSKEKVFGCTNDLPGREDVRPSGLSETEKTTLAQESLLDLVNADLQKTQKKRSAGT
jgi:hypothetical protein